MPLFQSPLASLHNTLEIYKGREVETIDALHYLYFSALFWRSHSLELLISQNAFPLIMRHRQRAVSPWSDCVVKAAW